MRDTEHGCERGLRERTGRRPAKPPRPDPLSEVAWCAVLESRYTRWGQTYEVPISGHLDGSSQPSVFRGTPRRSLGGHAFPSPIAGLPAAGSMVFVGPPPSSRT